jgi:ketosteroid isomerase-like protein
VTEQEKLVRDFIDIVLIRENRAAAEDYFATDAQIVGLEGVAHSSRFEFLRFLSMIQSQFAFVRFEIMQAICDGTWVSLMGQLVVTERGSTRTSDERFQSSVRIEDGRIVEAHFFTDFINFFESMGRLPPRTLDRCLTGERLRFS